MMDFLTDMEMFQGRNGRIVATFLLFVLIQFFFAAIYFVLYRGNRANFAFNADILEAQSDTVRSSLTDSVERLTGAAEALREALKELDDGAEPIVNERHDASLDLPSGRRVVMIFRTGPPAGGPAGSWLTVVESNGQELLDADPTEFSFRGWHNSSAWLKSREDWQAAIPRVLRPLEQRIQEERRRLRSLESSSPNVWSYWDFVYFSVIAQTTVGFGDMLPNSTLIRMLVAVHILVGYALLVVVLNIVLGT